MSRKTDKALDEIYAGPPAEFIKGRDALAKELRAGGDDEQARAVKALRKPSKAAAVVNALALDDPKPVKRYLALADKLRKVSSGKVDATKMRELAREEGELLEELVVRAGEIADGTGASTLDRVRETLQAAQVDADLAEQVLAGRVEREERAASVGLENLLAAPQAPARKKASKKTKAESAKRDKATRQRRQEAKAALKGAQAEAREAEREVARAEQALAQAERTRAAADRGVERAERKLSES